MKMYSFLLLGALVLILASASVFFLYGCSDASTREKAYIKATKNKYHYDNISGDLAFYKQIETVNKENYRGGGTMTIDVDNYTFSIALTDSLISFDTLKNQSHVIAKDIFNDVMLRDTLNYHYIIIHVGETKRDTVLSFLYRVTTL